MSCDVAHSGLVVGTLSGLDGVSGAVSSLGGFLQVLFPCRWLAPKPAVVCGVFSAGRHVVVFADAAHAPPRMAPPIKNGRNKTIPSLCS